jgi:hypothetical protein
MTSSNPYQRELIESLSSALRALDNIHEGPILAPCSVEHSRKSERLPTRKAVMKILIFGLLETATGENFTGVDGLAYPATAKADRLIHELALDLLQALHDDDKPDDDDKPEVSSAEIDPEMEAQTRAFSESIDRLTRPIRAIREQADQIGKAGQVFRRLLVTAEKLGPLSGDAAPPMEVLNRDAFKVMKRARREARKIRWKADETAQGGERPEGDLAGFVRVVFEIAGLEYGKGSTRQHLRSARKARGWSPEEKKKTRK